MARITPHSRQPVLPPPSYRSFIERSRKFVESKGLSWVLSVNEDGSVDQVGDWDLRLLTNAHARSASRMNGFAVHIETREKAIGAAWPTAMLPEGDVLSEDVQEFLKAVVAYRCKETVVPKSVRNEATIYRKFFSVTTKRPWELNTDDFNRFMQLEHSVTNVAPLVSGLAKLINANMLSLNVPLKPDVRLQSKTRIVQCLNDRNNDEKLPEPAVLHELTRIVFHETPVGHQDKLRFVVVKLLIFTGLRINEILMLRSDCLQWESHIDIVTGKPAGEVGGITRSLRLRYFGEKRSEGEPGLLVEDYQWIPERFQDVVASSVESVLSATQPLRDSLQRRRHPARQFKTVGGEKLLLDDMLFLVIPGHRGDLPTAVRQVTIDTVAPSSFSAFLGGTLRKGRLTIFTRYGSAENCETMHINPHSLRHLMNTEFFRLNVPDTVITQHFGRTTVVQSYVYDHRSVAERLSFVQLPPAAEGIIRVGTSQETVAKMVISGFAATSHVAKSFKKIQSEHGDEAAFNFLASSSDGFHVTPYGFCITSFAMNPCLRHLQCFNNCKSYVASGIRTHTVSLDQLKTNLIAMRKTAAAKPVTSIGRKNQIAHADQLIAGVNAALNAQPGEAVFPEGQDHSAPVKDLFK
jgi:hypothetical protein